MGCTCCQITFEGDRQWERCKRTPRTIKPASFRLRKVYSLFVGSIEPNYRQEVSSCFQLVAAAEQKSYRISIVDISLALRNVDQIDESLDLVYLNEDTNIRITRRLTSKTKDLLEIDRGRRNGTKTSPINILKESPQVVYMHRTVAHYLQTQSIEVKTIHNILNSEFNANLALLKSNALKLKFVESVTWSEAYVWDTIQYVLEFSGAHKANSDAEARIWLELIDAAILTRIRDALHASQNAEIGSTVFYNMGLGLELLVSQGLGFDCNQMVGKLIVCIFRDV
jgi:hypothetical protein